MLLDLALVGGVRVVEQVLPDLGVLLHPLSQAHLDLLVQGLVVADLSLELFADILELAS